MDFMKMIEDRLRYYHEQSKKYLRQGDPETAEKYMNKFERLANKTERALKEK